MKRGVIGFLLVLAVAAVAAGPLRAEFPIAETASSEGRAAVAYNSRENEFAVAYLVQEGGVDVVEVGRFAADGTPIGSPTRPFGTVGALGRPDIVYSSYSWEYLVVVPTEGGAGSDDIVGRRLDIDLSFVSGVIDFFTGLPDRQYVDGHGVSSLRVVYNDFLIEYLVTVQLDTSASGTPDTAVWGQLIAVDEAYIVPAERLTPTSIKPWSHGVAHARIWTSPLGGGRYLLAAEGETGSPQLFLFDRDLGVVVSDIPFDWGAPVGDEGFADVAYGPISGTWSFLVVWSDGNNCEYGEDCLTDPLLERFGIWGGFVDAYDTDYTPGVPENISFPIDTLAMPRPGYGWRTPRAEYNESARKFFISWDEMPVNDPANDGDQKCTHIRGAWVDSLAGLVSANVVLSDVTCDCPTQGAGGPPYCISDEDPELPDIAPLGNSAAVTVWQQTDPLAPSSLDVYGTTFGYPPPVNDMMANAIDLTGTSVAVDCTLLGATTDGSSTCGFTTESPDVWYRYSAPSSGTLQVTTCGTNDLWGPDTGTNTVLSIHDAAGAQIDTEGCNDDFESGNDPTACASTDVGLQKYDSAIARSMPAGSTWLFRVTRDQFANGGQCRFNLEFTPDGGGGGGSGRVPSGALLPDDPLTVDKAAGDQVTLAWSQSCLSSDSDYAVYEGTIGDFTSHQPRLCTTGGVMNATLSPGAGDVYYLVVPTNGTYEGSYGLRSGDVERPMSTGACLASQLIEACD